MVARHVGKGGGAVSRTFAQGERVRITPFVPVVLVVVLPASPRFLKIRVEVGRH